MVNKAATISLSKESEVKSLKNGDFWRQSSAESPEISLFDRVLPLIKLVVEYSFGLYAGFVIGWLLGLLAGNIYLEHVRPLNFSDLNQINQRMLVPYHFARKAAFIVAGLGAFSIALINSRLLNQRIITLYENKITDPCDLARILGDRVSRIERKMKRLSKTGKITCQRGLRESLVVKSVNEHLKTVFR